MHRPLTNPASALMVFLLISVVIADSITSAFPMERRHFFTTCWGWGAGCSMHNAVGRGLTPTGSISRSAQSREPTNAFVSRDRFHTGIPSIVTSGGWEPGTMGKRTPSRKDHLLAVLEQAFADNGLQV